MKQDELKAIICLPTYNEINSIDSMIDGIRSQGFEVLVTDGGSTDGTTQRARKKGVTLLERPGRGKGYGLQQAVQFADENKIPVIVFIDCDMTYPVEMISALIKNMDAFDMVVGARKMADIKYLNRMANYFFTGLINALYSANLKDTQSGMRALKISRYKDLITANYIDVESELTCKSLRRNHSIMEVDIDYYPRVGESKAGIVEACRILYRIMRCRF